MEAGHRVLRFGADGCFVHTLLRLQQRILRSRQTSLHPLTSSNARLRNGAHNASLRPQEEPRLLRRIPPRAHQCCHPHRLRAHAARNRLRLRTSTSHSSIVLPPCRMRLTNVATLGLKHSKPPHPRPRPLAAPQPPPQPRHPRSHNLLLPLPRALAQRSRRDRHALYSRCRSGCK